MRITPLDRADTQREIQPLARGFAQNEISPHAAAWTARARGIAQAALDVVSTYAPQRCAFGGPIAGFQGIQLPMAVQPLDGHGRSQEYPAERLCRDAKITEVHEETSPIQRVVIARGLLGEASRS